MQIRVKYRSVDEYLSYYPEEVQNKLESLRSVIKKAAPKAVETISYNMPAYKQRNVLVYFAAHKNHIGFYPTSSGTREFIDQLTKYKVSKGAIQFPIDEPLPLGLIAKIVRFRVKEDKEKAAGRLMGASSLSQPKTL
ncbi:MAG TPA: DUF1801 domain-containing protein [Puia sp.]|jgi:uncharacterized protein YdhG (YjbR/CyaY superfamily)|nr:DUF1801 domain-containing protein [Puia sp.]